jgi:hypothetical protein
MYEYAPSVQNAVDDSFEFHTSNTKSSYFGKFSNISKYDIINKVENDYYKMFSYDNLVEMRGKEYADSIINCSPWNKLDGELLALSKAEGQIGDDGGRCIMVIIVLITNTSPLLFGLSYTMYGTILKPQKETTFFCMDL